MINYDLLNYLICAGTDKEHLGKKLVEIATSVKHEKGELLKVLSMIVDVLKVSKDLKGAPEQYIAHAKVVQTEIL